MKTWTLEELKKIIEEIKFEVPPAGVYATLWTAIDHDTLIKRLEEDAKNG